MNPGERLNVRVSMQNDGAASPQNDWNNNYVLQRTNNSWAWVYDRVTAPPDVTPGNINDFDFVITAPNTPGTYTFGAQMRIRGDNPAFGTPISIPNIDVNAANPPRWDCTENGATNIPATMGPGETVAVSLVVDNTGTATWGATGFCLRSQDSPSSFWAGPVCPASGAAVAPGGTATFNFNITAPMTPGVYPFERQMFDANPVGPTGGVGFFDKLNACVFRNITVGGATPLDASLTANTLPGTIAPGEVRSVSVTMTNDGTDDWLADGDFVLYSQSTPTSLWGVTTIPVTAVTTNGNQFVFTFDITAPTTPGGYNHRWQMRKLANPSAGFFGELVDVPVTVAGTPPLGASVVAQTIPNRMTAGMTYSFTIEMNNSGQANWSGDDFALGSDNTPTSLWGVTNIRLGAAEVVAPAANRVFTFNVTAPAAGNYTSRWQMREIGGIEFFGDAAVTNNILVTDCGNNIMDVGEDCDDGNLIDGDGCSSTCTLEQLTIDLNVDNADRTFTGSTFNKGLANVEVGDVNNDGTPDVAMGEASHVVPADAPFRNQAGRVFVFFGGAGLLDGSTGAVPGARNVEIWGADAGDQVGHTAEGGIQIGDVTGDGVQDLVVSGASDDGPGNTRAQAGGIYVINGGAILNGTDTVDLADGTATPTISAYIYGAAGDEIKVLAAGVDLGGTAAGDLLIGAPRANGGNGQYYILYGPVTGDIDLAASADVVITLPAGAGNTLGQIGAVGDLSGDGNADLLLGAPVYDGPNGSNSGAAFAVFAPFGATVNLSLAAGAAGGPDVVWFGEGANDRYGASVGIGNVIGAAPGEAVIGAIQHRSGGLQVGVADVWTGLTSGTTNDLGAGVPPTPVARVFGADQYDNLGSAIHVVDMDADGNDDVCVAASSADGPANGRDRAGELFCYAGGNTNLAATPFLIVYGAVTLGRIGHHVSNMGAGDIDGDGRNDLCTGSYRADVGGTAAVGRVDCFRSRF